MLFIVTFWDVTSRIYTILELKEKQYIQNILIIFPKIRNNN